MPTPTDAELVVAAITELADTDADGAAEQILSEVRNDTEALFIACGLAGWLMRQQPTARDSLREMALTIARSADTP